MTLGTLKRLLAAIPDQFDSVKVSIAYRGSSRALFQVRIIPDHNPDGEPAQVILVPWRPGMVRRGNDFLPPDEEK